MISLFKSLYNQGLIVEAYDIPVKAAEFNTLRLKIPNLNKLTNDQFAEFVDWLNNAVFDGVDEGDKIVFCGTIEKDFKIPRYLATAVQNSKLPDFIELHDFKGTDGSICIKYTENNREKVGKIAQMGNGSYGRVTTREQEMATCLAWNALIMEVDNIKDYDGRTKKSIIDSPKELKQLVSELGENICNGDWIKSIQFQIGAIQRFLKSRGLNWTDYRMCRYGHEDYISKSGVPMESYVGAAHEKFVKAYMDLIARQDDENNQKVQKDNFDPSDVILYKRNNINSIVKKFGEMSSAAKSATTSESILELYRKMYADNELFGISLKKMASGGSYQVFNISKQTADSNIKIESVTNNKKSTSNAHQAELAITGKFNLSGVSDPDDPEYNLITNKVIATVRSFGDSNGMDIKEESGPAIGKVPVRIWTKALNVNANDLDAAIAEFEKWTVEEKWPALAEIVAAGMKNGPWCLPFILIH